MSIHHFDLLRYVLGREVTTITCRTWDPEWSLFTGPSEGVALIDCGADVVASYRASWVSSGPRTAWAGEWRMDFAGGEVWWTSRGDGPEGGARTWSRFAAAGSWRPSSCRVWSASTGRAA